MAGTEAAWKSLTGVWCSPAVWEQLPAAAAAPPRGVQGGLSLRGSGRLQPLASCPGMLCTGLTGGKRPSPVLGGKRIKEVEFRWL